MTPQTTRSFSKIILIQGSQNPGKGLRLLNSPLQNSCGIIGVEIRDYNVSSFIYKIIKIVMSEIFRDDGPAYDHLHNARVEHERFFGQDPSAAVNCYRKNRQACFNSCCEGALFKFMDRSIGPTSCLLQKTLH